MYKDISGRTRKTIRRMPYRAIPMLSDYTPRCRWEDAGKVEANPGISFIGAGSWEPCERGAGRSGEGLTHCSHTRSVNLDCAQTTKAASERSIMSSLPSRCFLFDSLRESKGAPLAHFVMTKDRSPSKAGASVLSQFLMCFVLSSGPEF